MNSKKYETWFNYFNNLQYEIQGLVDSKKELNTALMNFIYEYQLTETKIYTVLFNALIFYKKRRYLYNHQITKLREKQIKYQRQLKSLLIKKKNLTAPQLDKNIPISIESKKDYIKEIENKLSDLNKTIEIRVLDIEEENEIVEKIRRLEKSKQVNIQRLIELEQKQIREIENSDYYKTHRKIENTEMKLTDVNIDLNRYAYKRLNSHKKVLFLYRKVRDFEKIKIKLENELLENRNVAADSYELVLKLSNQNHINLFKELYNQSKNKTSLKVLVPKKKRVKVEKKKAYTKLKNEKLTIALEKQKAGKKLDFYELKLILENSKK
ncbi:MAG: hypothetical protein ACFFEN_05515 [Candidatus Thorarchaeota archaeon]